MANYNELAAAIRAAVRQNGNNEITGNVLQGILVSIVNSLGNGYQFYGVASPTTNPGQPDARVFYITSAQGTYTYFGGIIVSENELVVLKGTGTAWEKNVIATLGGSGGGIPEAPITGGPYGRQNRDWVEITGGSGVISVNGRTGAVTIEADDIPTNLPDVTVGYAWELKPSSVVRWRQISEKPTILPDAPDNKTYGRKYGQWVEITGGGGVTSVNGKTGVVTLGVNDITNAVADVDNDNKLYGRRNKSWVEITSGGGIPDAPDNKLYGRTQGSWREITGGGASLLPTIDIEYTISGNWEVSSDVDLGNVVAELQNNTNNPITLCKMGTGLCMSCVSKTHIITASSDDWKLVFEEANAVDTGFKRWTVFIDNRTENPNSSVSFEVINGSGTSTYSIQVGIGEGGYEIDNTQAEMLAIFNALQSNNGTPVTLYDTERGVTALCYKKYYDGGAWKLCFKTALYSKGGVEGAEGYDYWSVNIDSDGVATLTQPIPVSYENLAAPTLVKRKYISPNGTVQKYSIKVTHPVMDIDKDAEAVLMVYRRRNGSKHVYNSDPSKYKRTNKYGWAVLRGGYERRADTSVNPPIVSVPILPLITKSEFTIDNLRNYVIRLLGNVENYEPKQVFDSNGYEWWTDISRRSLLKGFRNSKGPYAGYKLLGVAIRVPNPEFYKYANMSVVAEDTQEWIVKIGSTKKYIPRYFYSAVAPLKAVLHSYIHYSDIHTVLDFFFPQPR